VKCTRCGKGDYWTHDRAIVVFRATGRLFSLAGNYTPKSREPEIRLCADCLDEIWPAWRTAETPA
jgi:hypothetical protein